jgi:hypothetical protein
MSCGLSLESTRDEDGNHGMEVEDEEDKHREEVQE